MTILAPTRQPPAPERPSRARRWLELRKVLLPSVALLAVFLLGPILYSLYGSLTDRSLTRTSAANFQFVGVQNYVQLLGSPVFWSSLVLTLVFVVGSALIGQNVLGLALAMLMRSVTAAR